MESQDINRISVLGAGNMGHGIAEVAALAGYDVTLRDIEEELVSGGYDQIEWSLGKLVEKDRLTEAEADAALDRITPLVDLEAAVEDADVVIEAVPEKMEIKREVYRELEAYAPDRTIFATNTSSLSITELSEQTDRPSQFCGMHFFNPPVRMALVEVIAGAHTDDETLEAVEALAESMDKTPVRVNRDVPGFIVNRVLVPLINEGGWLVESGDATIAEVDSTSKYDMGLPMGLFELTDQVGIDVGYHVLEYMHEVLGPAYEPCPLLEAKLEAGDLGKKTGRGFYDYESGEGVQIPTDEMRDDVKRRLLAVMANDVAALVDRDVADPAAIDRALQLGAGFPDGPAKLADEAGLDVLVETLDEQFDATGAARYEAHDHLRALASAGEGFYGDEADADEPTFESIRVEYPGDMVGQIVLDRPHRMNSLSPDLLRELGDAVELLADDDEVRAILLTGEGDRAFSAGADVTAVTAGSSIDAIDVSRMGHDVFGRLKSCDMPVLAAIDGYCLGGGMELATAADLRIATERSTFGQTEHNLGLLPGWGGTQRLQRIVGEGRAKEIIFTADHYDAATMREFGFLNDVVPHTEFEAEAHDLAAKLASGPPIAQALTKRAMHLGQDDIEAGLELEAQAFGHVLGTDDVMEGVAAFMEDRDPEFEGQ
jgi:enoyl-CoA hydratase/3-hydroxyacyl-CoA dehydrogenase